MQMIGDNIITIESKAGVLFNVCKDIGLAVWMQDLMEA